MKASDRERERVEAGEAMWTSHGNRALLVVARRQAEGDILPLK